MWSSVSSCFWTLLFHSRHVLSQRYKTEHTKSADKTWAMMGYMKLNWEKSALILNPCKWKCNQSSVLCVFDTVWDTWLTLFEHIYINRYIYIYMVVTKWVIWCVYDVMCLFWSGQLLNMCFTLKETCWFCCVCVCLFVLMQQSSEPLPNFTRA